MIQLLIKKKFTCYSLKVDHRIEVSRHGLPERCLEIAGSMTIGLIVWQCYDVHLHKFVFQMQQVESFYLKWLCCYLSTLFGVAQPLDNDPLPTIK